ncbi:MAG: DUF885 family protein [Planctomycetota bacterium]
MSRFFGLALAVLLASTSGLSAQTRTVADLEPLVTAYFADLQDLLRRYDVPLSAEGAQRRRRYLEERARMFRDYPREGLPRDAEIDLWLLAADVEHRLATADREAAVLAQIDPLLAHTAPLIAACEARRRHEPVDAEASAAMLLTATAQASELLHRLEAGAFDQLSPPLVRTAVDELAQLHRALTAWRTFHDGYDPSFSWWTRAPWQRYADTAQRYRDALRARLEGGKTGDASLVGDPIGEPALLADLRHERIPYSPAELIEIAEREFGFCEQEAVRASTALGFGGDWGKALAHVKTKHRAPGSQPQLIRELATEAIAFLDARDLLTIPDLARECWRMGMMSPEQQRVNPFFLGGETILVSFPTDAMDHDQKLQSLRSNNEHFCRATVHHELIPGHWLQQYMQARHRTYRAPFETPFWIEGWALYWEMRLYDLGFAKSDEDRIGMLYWRKHRCARIVFSLNFHLGRWTAEQCVDYLIERVGHERAAAEAEVRRSVQGGYSPLYQAAYMLGGLQLKALHRELVVFGSMTERAFHDAVLQQNAIPIALVRAALSPSTPTAESIAGWRFADAK